ncbi:MAG: FHA domain-containing protein [Candidatus Competibacteraceae bacterium]|nr:FHA domain-containing protein [Candidatus Competibacteraceae bacterium]
MSTVDFTYPPELKRFVHYQPESLGPIPANLRELEQLLQEIWSKTSGKTEDDQRVLDHFQDVCGLNKELVTEREQRTLKLLNKQQPIVVGFNAAPDYRPGRPSVLSALVMNTTGWVFKEVRVRFESSDLALREHAQPRPIKLLEGHDALPVYLHYRAPKDALLATLSVALEVCDHRGEWQAYTSRYNVLLNFPPPDNDPVVKIRTAGGSRSATNFSLPHLRGKQRWEKDDSPDQSNELGDGGLPLSPGRQLPSLDNLLPIELEANWLRTHQLQAEAEASQAVARLGKEGTPLSRALLLSHNATYAPERIEIVSRPFIVCGRYNENTSISFGDFALGFLPAYGMISRLHFALCATGDGLAVMHAGINPTSDTGLNDQRLLRGRWQRLESGDVLDICGLYQLKVALGWSTTLDLTTTEDSGTFSQAEELGECLLEVVSLVKELEQASATALKQKLRTRFAALKRMQEQAAALNGINSPGLLLYARFYREDISQRRITHVYLPKRISLGSSQQAGLRVEAPDVAPQHAELSFKDGMYWLKNLVGYGEVTVAQQPLETEETVALSHGDEVQIGMAHFVFEGY